MVNEEIAKILLETAELLEMQDVPFKPRAFEKAALAIQDLEDDVADVYKKGGIKALEEIPGVGKGIAERIEEYIKTKHIKDYDRLKKKMPVDIAGLTVLEGVGPHIIKTLYKKLKVRTVRDLERAAKTGKLRTLPRFGEKLEKRILHSIEFQKQSGGRFLLGDVLPIARRIETQLKKVNGVKRVLVAGSLRRWEETIGDIDILATSSHPQLAIDYFLKLPEVKHVYAKGKTKAAVRLSPPAGGGIDADLRVVKDTSFGAVAQYFTGNKAHNVELRKIAIKKGYKLNEYGLFKGKKQVAGRTEEEIYKKLGLRWIPSEMRLSKGEIEASRQNKLPLLVELRDIKGDLQTQTNWTDGSNSIEEMAEEAKKLGYEYIAITDHTKSLAMTGGADEKKILKQVAYINKLNLKINPPAGGQKSKFKILTGAEVNILKDGSLDIKNEALAKLDLVGAAVHSHFKLSKKEQTARIIRAMENPHVDIIFHLTARRLYYRPAIELDIDEIIRAAKRTRTVLEVDGFPSRLDLNGEHVRKAVAAGVKLVVNTDAHSTSHLHYMEYGVAQCRRGWATKADVLNTKPLAQFLKSLK